MKIDQNDLKILKMKEIQMKIDGNYQKKWKKGQNSKNWNKNW